MKLTRTVSGGAVPSTAGGVPQGNPRARKAAQKGLSFLARETVAWQKTHQCYGCHVQAVSLEALSVGQHHQYEVSSEDLKAIAQGMLNLSGGARKNKGLS